MWQAANELFRFTDFRLGGDDLTLSLFLGLTAFLIWATSRGLLGREFYHHWHHRRRGKASTCDACARYFCGESARDGTLERREFDYAAMAGALIPERGGSSNGPSVASAARLHPELGIPARCFAYVGDESDPATWKLPYRHPDGRIDDERLPDTIRDFLKSYLGGSTDGIPQSAMPIVIARLAEAAKAGSAVNATVVDPEYEELEAILRWLKSVAS